VRGAAIVLILAGCVRSAPDAAPPRSFPTLEPDPVFDPNPIGLADLRSIASAASIALEIGPGPVLTTRTCDLPGAPAAAALHGGGKCYRCTLAVADPEPGEALHPLEVPLRTLAHTLLAYPHSFLRVAQVQRIALCHKLEREPSTEDHIAGLAEGATRRLMVSVGRRDAAHADATLHHEIFHLFDEATAPGGDHRRDPEWERINPRSFRYGDPASALQVGFVSDYARTNPAEDKASVFEYMMSFPDELCARAVDDPLLMAKARLLLSRIEAAVPPGLGRFAGRKAACLARL
jgi:hypothetical protein